MIKLIQYVLQPRYVMHILNGDLVYGSAIHTHPHRTIFLWD